MWLQLMQGLLARVQRTEAALDLAPPPPPAPTPAVTLDDMPQQLPSAGSLLQEFQEIESDSDFDDDCQSDSAAEPSTSMAEPVCSSEQAAASDTCVSRSSEASASGQDGSASSTQQAAALHSSLGGSSEVSTSGWDLQPDAASARLVESLAQQADLGSHGSVQQDDLVCRSDGFSTQRDMPAASQDQCEDGSVQFGSGMADEQASGSSSVADAAAVQRPKRRFRNFFRFRPDDNKFL